MSPFEAAAQSGEINWVKRRSAGNDVKIGNYALTLEYLEAAFYRRAVARGGLSDPDVRRFARTVRSHEVAHVRALKDVLGKAAVRAPKVEFGNAVTDQDTFLEVAAAIEPVGTAAYAGAGPWIKSLPILRAALSIHSVEANHAAWVAALRQYKFGANASPAPRAFNPAYSRKRTLKIVADTGFVQ